MARKRTTKKSSGSKYIILLLIAVVAIAAAAAGIFYASDRSEKDVLEDKGGGADKEISLLDESIEAQRLVDNILLQKDNWQLIENEHGEKDVAVTEKSAKVKINQRQLAVGVPGSTSLAGAGQWLEDKVKAAGLEYISGAEATYKTWDAYKVEVGISVKAGDGRKSFVTDTIYFFHNSNLTKEDKDIKDKKSEKKKEEPKQTARRYSGKLAIIVDDCGYDLSSVRTLTDTGLPFSYAILPYKQFSSDVLEIVKNTGHVPMLHLPMEPLDRSAMSEGSVTILTDMSRDQVISLTRKAVNSLPGIMGINNHQGSKATANAATMKAAMQEIKRQGLFFVDSRTNSKSVGASTAQAMGVPTARNDIFLDNSSDVSAIRQQIYKAMEMAEKNGSAIAICHARPNTAKAWKMYADEFKKTGITFVHVTDLLY